MAECPWDYYDQRDKRRKEEHFKEYLLKEQERKDYLALDEEQRRIIDEKNRIKNMPKRRCMAMAKCGRPCRSVEGSYDNVFTSDGFCMFHKKHSKDEEYSEPRESLLGVFKEEHFSMIEKITP